MGKSFFQFKQFRIDQGRSAMKVCTDACLFGASIPTIGKQKILDVGCGTGLLSLMMAQQNSLSQIDAIEPHEGSFLDAQFNVSQSLWADRIKVFQKKFQEWLPDHSGLYDVVVCNPPFFFNHLLSPQNSRNQALHLNDTEWNDWLLGLSGFLKRTGRLWLLLSPGSWQKTELLLRKLSFYPFEIQTILQKNDKPFRVIAGISTAVLEPVNFKTHNVYRAEGRLSEWAEKLLSEFYLDKV